MKTHFCLLAVLLFLTGALFSTSSSSETYRCLIDGKTVYGQVPCPGSQGTVEEDMTRKQEKAKRAKEEATKQQESRDKKFNAEQSRFEDNSKQANQCVTQETPCSTYSLQRYLKGLPIGWVEKALGPPQNVQRIGGEDTYYWTLTLDDNGKKHTYRLQLQYGSECRTINGYGACVFNFYG
jgi:hypothetical protein